MKEKFIFLQGTFKQGHAGIQQNLSEFVREQNKPKAFTPAPTQIIHTLKTVKIHFKMQRDGQAK